MPGVHKEVEPSLVALSGSLAQSLDFLAGTKKPSFPNRNLITSGYRNCLCLKVIDMFHVSR